jgi:hypothetical protein
VLLLDREHIDADFADDAHPGTSDVDNVLHVEMVTEATDYSQLLTVLEDLGFTPHRRNNGQQTVWQWERSINSATVVVELLVPDDGVVKADGSPAAGRIGVSSPVGPGDVIGAQRMPATELALRDAVPRVLKGIALVAEPNRPEPGVNDVKIWVANLLPWLVLKARALNGRNKEKDAFDIVWMITRWPGGPAGAARHALTSVIRADPLVDDAMHMLRTCFATEASEGCGRYVNFIADSRKFPRLERSRAYAHGAVRAFLAAWDAT